MGSHDTRITGDLLQASTNIHHRYDSTAEPGRIVASFDEGEPGHSFGRLLAGERK